MKVKVEERGLCDIDAGVVRNLVNPKRDYRNSNKENYIDTSIQSSKLQYIEPEFQLVTHRRKTVPAKPRKFGNKSFICIRCGH